MTVVDPVGKELLVERCIVYDEATDTAVHFTVTCVGEFFVAVTPVGTGTVVVAFFIVLQALVSVGAVARIWQ